MERLDLSEYDGVLAFGDVLRREYERRGWGRRVWTWHEAADVRRFRPELPLDGQRSDLVWIGNWGDDERTAELEEFLIAPAAALRLTGHVYGVRYPAEARDRLARTGLQYAGWTPNYAVPGIFGRHRVTVHVPRRPYATRLPGIPTIRVFEALACGIPLICAPWEDTEGLFQEGRDYLLARSGEEMRERLRDLLHDSACALALSRSGLQTIRARHTCAHRAVELLAILDRLRVSQPASEVA
jgi:spore maturation protein CgeB